MKFALAICTMGLVAVLLHGCGGGSSPSPSPSPTPGPSKIPNVKLNNGIEMPLISIGTWEYNSSTAEAVVRMALKAGFNHIDTALGYGNQDGVGKALAGVERSKFFLTTKVPDVPNASAYNVTRAQLETDLKLLNLSYVDLMLVHAPDGDLLCKDSAEQCCNYTQQQWKALEDFLAEGKVKAIGVSNYCVSSFQCINKTLKVQPAVNQVKFHVGMGPDPLTLVSYGHKHGIVTQAYSPLGDGTMELINGTLVSGIGKEHNVSGPQISMRWIIEKGAALSTKTTKLAHMQEDLEIFSFNLTANDTSRLDSATTPADKPSWGCSKEAVSTIVV